MHRIKQNIKILVLLLTAISCTNDDNQDNSFSEPFVRFNFLVNSNNEPLEYPSVSSALIPISSYTNSSIAPVKIPVTLSSETLSETITVNFSVASSGNEDTFSVYPENQVSFSGTQLTDTIYVSFNERWTEYQTINFSLDSASDTSINIGNINDSYPNNTFTINLEDIETYYTIETNRIEIKGEQGEEITFNVNFPNGFIESEIDTTSIFEFLNGFDYSLTTEYISEDKTYITYKITLDEDIQNDDVYYESVITLLDTDNYSVSGNSTLQIVKPIITERDNAVFTASNFYNLNDTYHRTYGEVWSDFNEDGVCEWGYFFAFTYPVVVDATHPNAVLYSDNGTEDTSDDIYHHAFQIGFGSSTTITTNSFNLKRWFSNELTSTADSPGFNVSPAIEFFPENGSSTNKGSILIIPQFISISANNGNTHSIAISGEGTYQEISDGLFELKFTLNATNEAVFGGTVSAEYRIYSNNSYTDPEDLTNANCISVYEL